MENRKCLILNHLKTNKIIFKPTKVNFTILFKKGDNRLNSIKLIWKNKSDSFATVGEILAFDEKTNFFTVITCIEE